MFDVLQIIFWSVTYVLIIVFSYGAHFKRIGGKVMPAVPAMLNISWETVALVSSHGFWGHWLWLGLDILIYIYHVYCETKATTLCIDELLVRVDICACVPNREWNAGIIICD